MCLFHTRMASQDSEASPAAGLEQAVLEGEGDASKGSIAPCPSFLDPCARADGGPQPSLGRRRIRDIMHSLRPLCLCSRVGRVSSHWDVGSQSTDFPAGLSYPRQLA